MYISLIKSVNYIVQLKHCRILNKNLKIKINKEKNSHHNILSIRNLVGCWPVSQSGVDMFIILRIKNTGP